MLWPARLWKARRALPLPSLFTGDSEGGGGANPRQLQGCLRASTGARLWGPLGVAGRIGEALSGRG